MVVYLSLDDVFIEFSVEISPCLSGMSLLVETLVFAFSLLLQDGLTWKAESSFGWIINFQPFGAALTSSLSEMMHPAKSKKLISIFKVCQLSVRSFILRLSGGFSLFWGALELSPFGKWNSVNRQSFLSSHFLHVWQLNLYLLFWIIQMIYLICFLLFLVRLENYGSF